MPWYVIVGILVSLFILYLFWESSLDRYYMIPIDRDSNNRVVAIDVRNGTLITGFSEDLRGVRHYRPMVVYRTIKIISSGDKTKIEILKYCLKMHWPDLHREFFPEEYPKGVEY